MAFTAVGSFVQTTTTTLAVNPTRVGNFYVAEVIAFSNTVYASSISGGNCTWTQTGSKFLGTNNAFYATVFIGKATATGAANATIAFSGSTPSFGCVAQQFSSSIGSYAQDGLQGTLDLAVGTADSASLTPSGPGDLYFAYFYDSGTAVGGSTTGYTYDVTTGGNGVVFNPACGSGTQIPVWGDTGIVYGVAVLLKETPQTSQPRALRAQLPQPPRPRGRTGSNTGVPPKPAPVGPGFHAAVTAIRAKVPQQPVLNGRTSANKGAPVRNPTPGPAFYPFRQAVRIRPKLPPHGRIASSPGNPGPVTLTNNFSGGTNTTTITAGNSGGSSGSAFDAVSTGSGATTIFSSTNVAPGSVLSGEIATGGSSATSYVSWTVSQGTRKQVWFRMYLYFTANPGSNFRIFQATDLGGSNGAYVQVTTAGKLLFVNLASSTTITTSTASIPLNSWFRIEGFVLAGTSAGQTELRIYDNPTSTTVTETDTSGANLNLGTASLALYEYGLTAAAANIGPFWMGDIGLSSSGYLGPVFTTGPAFYQKTSPARVHPSLPKRGRTHKNAGAPVSAYPVPPPAASAEFTATPGAMLPGAIWPGNPFPFVPFRFTGHYPVYYLDYLDGTTRETLYAQPGGSYFILVANTRLGLTVPPDDGRWLGEAPQQDEVPLHRKMFLKLRRHIHRSRRRSGYRNPPGDAG